jgi:predicted kinase
MSGLLETTSYLKPNSKYRYNKYVNGKSAQVDIETLKKELGALPEPTVNPVFVIVSGLPGTEKTFFSRKLGKRLPAAVIQSDAIRKRLFRRPSYSAAESQKLFAACHQLIEELLTNGVSVILDATNLIERQREYLYRIADTLSVKMIIAWMHAPPELVRERIGNRVVETENQSDADLQVYERMKGRAQKIGRNYFSVDTSADIEPAIEKIIREAQR